MSEEKIRTEKEAEEEKEALTPEELQEIVGGQHAEQDNKLVN
jgi:hypothetical protein